MKIKTEATHGKDFTYRWSTHVPVINTIIEILKPYLIVELGVGFFSTPLLLKSKAQKTIHIENQEYWLQHIQDIHKNLLNEKNEFLLHSLHKSVELVTPEKELNEEIKQNIIQYYLNLSDKIKNMNYKKSMLVIDNYTCTRKISLDILTNCFNVVVYHDAEDEIYNYKNLDKSLFENYDNYILETPRTDTGIFIKKNTIKEEELKKVLNTYINNYTNDLSISKEGFNLTKKV
jgi:hypothetical protein